MILFLGFTGLNVFVVFIPISWVAHFLNANNPEGEGVFPFQATFVCA